MARGWGVGKKEVGGMRKQKKKRERGRVRMSFSRENPFITIRIL